MARSLSCARAIALSIASIWPLKTTCPGALSLATSHKDLPSEASFARASACSKVAPIKAAIPPFPTGTACCIAFPRMRKRRVVAARLYTPVVQRAEYSPKECPATKSVFFTKSKPISFPRTRITAMLTAIKAGWVLWVSLRSASSPENIKAESFWPRTSSTSWKTSLALKNVSLSSRPIPIYWEPWPGKTKAFIECSLS